MILVAESLDGVLEGFVQMFPSYSSVRLCRHWIVNDLYVATDARLRGLARALMRAAAETAKSLGAASLELATEKTNSAARNLYESIGWELDVEFDRYFLDCR